MRLPSSLDTGVKVKGAGVRIGELAERTGTSRRLLRYYEEQGLISPERADNGYREYDDRLVDRVQQIRGLLEAGLPTRIIARILPCLTVPGVLVCAEDASPEVLDVLATEHRRMGERIEVLSRNRDALADYLAAAAGPLPVGGSRVEADPGGGR